MKDALSPRGALSKGASAPHRPGRSGPRVLVLAALVAACTFPVGTGDARGQDTASSQDPAPRDPAREEFLKTNSLFNRELWDLAVPRYKALLERFPEFEERGRVRWALAVCHRSLAADAERAGDRAGRKHHLRRCAVNARKALEHRGLTERREALEMLAESLFRLDDPEGATKVWSILHARTRGAARARAAVGLGDAAYARGHFETASEHFRAALEYWRTRAEAPADAEEERDEGDGTGASDGTGAAGAGEASRQGDPAAERDRAAYHLGLSLYQLDDAARREAAGIFERLAERPGDFRADAVYMAALARQELGETDRALALFRELLPGTEDPSLREAALFGEGTILFERGDLDAAIDRLERLREEFPDGRHALRTGLYLGRALLETGATRRGVRLLNRLRRSEEVGAEASLWLGRTYGSRGKHSQAVTIIEAALRAYPGSPQEETLRLERCVELLADRRWKEGGAALEAFLESYPDSASRDHAEYLRAWAAHREGEIERSRELCGRFLETWPESRFRDDVHRLDAENLFLAGKPGEAAAAWAAWLESAAPAPGSEDAVLGRYRIAESRLRAGQVEEARRRLEALASGPAGKILKAAADHPVLGGYHFLLGDACYRLEDWTAAARHFEEHLRRAPERRPAEARFRRAHALQQAGELDAAREAYRDALAADPESRHAPQIRFELGQIAFEKGESSAARKAFEASLAAGPEGRLAPHAHRYLGWIAQQAGRSEEAAAHYRTLADDFPDHELHAEALYLLSLSLQAAGRPGEAREALARLEREHPEEGIGEKVRVQRAISLAREGELEEARGRLAALAELDLPPELGFLCRYELAWCCRDLDDAEAAAAAYRALLAFADEHPGADREGLARSGRLELAELEFDRGRFTEARRLLEPLAGGEGALREKALYRLCWCHYRTGDVDALDTTRTALAETFPQSAYRHETALLLARLRLDQGEPGRAAEVLRGIVDARPEPPEAEAALVTLAECRNEERRFAAARKLARDFLERYPGSSRAHRAHFALGWAAENAGDLDAAIASYREALGTGGEVSARAQFQIGQCLAARERWDDAIVEFLQVPARWEYPEWSSRAVLQVAGCFESLEDLERARRHYREVIETFPDRDEAKLARDRLRALP